MKIAVFSTKKYDELFFKKINEKYGYPFSFFSERLNEQTAMLADGHDIVCVFVNDKVDRATIQKLSELKVKAITLRCSGFNNVDLQAAKENKILVTNVPKYSPYCVAEHTIALMLSLNRQIQRAYNRVREGNFSIEGLMGFEMHGKTCGIIGLGNIGKQTAKILLGFGCRVLAHDAMKKPEMVKDLDIELVSLEELLKQSDIISLHCPLTPETHHLINDKTIANMKRGVMLINTSRGGLINTEDVLNGLKTGQIGHLGLDVYEEEENLFFQDLSTELIQDDLFARLLTLPNVIITAHQAFFTKEAVVSITETTLKNIQQITKDENCPNELTEHLSS